MSETSNKSILVCDFDGVLHSYSSGWKGAAEIPDPPVTGAMAFLAQACRVFTVAIFSSRSHQEGGIDAMKAWITGYATIALDEHEIETDAWVQELQFPLVKPAAMITLDDRAVRFNGVFPDPRDLKGFLTWQQRPPVMNYLITYMVDGQVNDVEMNMQQGPDLHSVAGIAGLKDFLIDHEFKGPLPEESQIAVLMIWPLDGTKEDPNTIVK